MGGSLVAKKLKKLIVVYNPRASHHAWIERDVLAHLRGVKGWMVGKYQIKATSFDDNVAGLAALLEDGDGVVVAGGDGTATMAINGVLKSGKDVAVGVMGYGNFDDISRMLGTEHGISLEQMLERLEKQELGQIYALDVTVNGRHWRYAPCYFTMGLLAEATELLNVPKVRDQLKTGKHGPLFSLRKAVGWYMKNHTGKQLPAGKLNGKAWQAGATDYLAVNGATMAKMMKVEHGGWNMNAKEFGSSVQELGKFWRMVKFGLRSVREEVPLDVTTGDVIEFNTPSGVRAHVEGEYEWLENVETIKVTKLERPLKVVMNRTD